MHSLIDLKNYLLIKKIILNYKKRKQVSNIFAEFMLYYNNNITVIL